MIELQHYDVNPSIIFADIMRGAYNDLVGELCYSSKSLPLDCQTGLESHTQTF